MEARAIARSRKYALLISAWDDGVANWNPIIASAGRIRLKSFNNDRENMREFLTEQAGFDRNCIYELKATQKTTPDDVRIWFGAIRRLVESQDSDAFVVVHYSGHGTFKVDPDGDEKSESSGGGGFGGWGFKRRLNFSKDEILAVHEECCIVDDELHELLDFGSNSSTLCLLDCCHSGTMADLKYKYAGAPLKPALARKGGGAKKPLTRVISLSGCTDKQEAKMSALDGETVGNLTKALLLAWREVGGQGLTLRTGLFPRVKSVVNELTRGNQEPVMCASFEMAMGATPLDPATWE